MKVGLAFYTEILGFQIEYQRPEDGLPVMPEPGKVMTPARTISRMRPLRLNGADLSSRFQLGLNAIRIILR
jgi:hypothetical protein